MPASDFFCFDKVLFWGRFLNNLAYGYGCFASTVVLLDDSENIGQARDRWDTIFAPARNKCAAQLYSIGCNFQTFDSSVQRQVKAVERINLIRVRSAEVFCHTYSPNRCIAELLDRGPLYFDDDHISGIGASVVVAEIVNRLNDKG